MSALRKLAGRNLEDQNSAEVSNSSNSRRREFLYLLGSVLFPVAACAPGASGLQGNGASPPLRIGVSGNNAPLIYQAGRGQFQGVEATFARMLGEELGREVRFVSMRFDRLIPALQNGDIDIIMSGMTVTTQRRSLVDFTSPYMASGQTILVRNSRASQFEDPRLLFMSPFRVGVERGAIGEALASRLHPGTTVVPFATPERAANAMLADRVDVVLHDAPVLWHLAARNSRADYRMITRLLASENLAWAVRRGDASMLAQANAALSKWRANGSLHRTLAHYMPHYQVLQRM